MRTFLKLIFLLFVLSCKQADKDFTPSFKLIPSEKFLFKSFVDCNMAEAWIGDTLRIFAGKYGEDPVWGDSKRIGVCQRKKCRRSFFDTSREFY